MEYLNKLGFTNIESLSGFHNEVYIGNIEDSKVIIRVSRSERRSKELVLSEMKFINELNKNMNVIEPFLLDGKSIFEYEDKVITLFKYVEGYKWNELEHTLDIIYNAGKKLALIHDISCKGDIKYSRPDYKEHNDLKLFLKNYTDKVYIDEYNETINEIEKNNNKDNYFLIHGDYLYSNLIYGDDLTVIDFDDCEYGYYQYDIAVYMFYYLLGGDPSNMDIDSNKERFEYFIKGYKEIRNTNINTLEDLNPFFRLRQMKLLGTIAEYSKGKLGIWQEKYVSSSLERISGKKKFI